MKRKLLLILMIMLVFAVWSPEADAEETELFGTDELSSFLDEDIAGKMEETEISEGEFSGVWKVVGDAFKVSAESLKAPLRCFAYIAAGAVVVSVLEAYARNDSMLSFGIAAGAAVVAVQGISELIELLAQVCRGISAFLMGAVPVYAGLLISSGDPSAGTAYGSVTLLLANVISFLASRMIIPSMSVLMGLGITSCFSAYKVSGIIGSVYRPVKWILTFAVSAFSGLISLQTFISGRIGAAGIKTAKQLVSSAVPVVGAALGDGVEAVRQSLALLRTGAGAFGLIAELLIFAPVLTSGLLWFLCFSAASVICEIFDAGKLKNFTDSCLMIVRMILAVAVSVFVVSVVTAAVVVCAGE